MRTSHPCVPSLPPSSDSEIPEIPVDPTEVEEPEPRILWRVLDPQIPIGFEGPVGLERLGMKLRPIFVPQDHWSSRTGDPRRDPGPS